jgi:hypothetical protein
MPIAITFLDVHKRKPSPCKPAQKWGLPSGTLGSLTPTLAGFIIVGVQVPEGGNYMPARLVGVCVAVAAFLHLGSKKQESKSVEQQIVDSFNKSHESWVAKGWVSPR